MHLLNVATLFLVLSLVGAEFSVSAFVNPAAWRLAPEPQLQMLSRFAFVLGKVMPVWYPVCAVMLGAETWFHWHQSEFKVLLAADAVWLFASVASIFFLVPLNTRVAEGAAGWQEMHRTWDTRHRVRIAALAIAGALVGYVVVC